MKTPHTNPPAQVSRTYPVFWKPAHAARQRMRSGLLGSALAAMFAMVAVPADASIAYGSINNFDTVNDTGHECHGFEIDIEDCHSTDITYTYNYNHYGVPLITEDNSVAGHPKTIIRWESKKNANGTWAAYTAIPAGPIPPTQGHQFTNPAVNFGGEHFGAGYNKAVGAVHYNWLIDGGSGTLVNGGAVEVSTPVYTYYPPAAGVVAQVQAVIVPPPPPAPPPLQFGKAVWVKEIKTTTHNAGKVKLAELLPANPDHPEKKNWKNGEPDEVETEWQILQKDSTKADGGVNAKKAAAAENLPNGNEVVTRRYEFYKYTGPLDAETGEAMATAVAADGTHGSGSATYADSWSFATAEWVIVTTDMATKVVVGDFTGAQMAAVDVDAAVGLIEHVSEGKVNTAYAARTVVVEGSRPFTSVREGALPPGMAFNEVTGVLSGTPTASGQFNFKVTANDGLNPAVSKNYTLAVAAPGVAPAPASLIDTTASPVGTGTTTGDGSYVPGANVTVNAVANAGYRFVNWTDNGNVVSVLASYTFVIDVNHSLVANFTPDVPQRTITTSASPAAGGSTSGGGIVDDGTSVTVVATPNAGYTFTNWTVAGAQVSAVASYTFSASADLTLVANFSAVPTYAVATSAAPLAGGTTTGDGSYTSGSSATVVASANAGYAFTKWTVSGTQVSTSPSYTFTVTANKTLVANFVVAGQVKTIATSANPAAGGTTTGGGNYATGDSATVVATANPGYQFSKWQEGGSGTASSSASYTFTVSANRTLVAKFNQVFSITASASPAVGGTTEMDSLIYKTGDTAQARAFPASGYTFANWTVSGAVVSTANPYSFPATGNRVLVANFTSNTGVTITANSAPAAGGTVTGDGAYVIGDSVTVSATPNAGYAFANWTVGGAIVSTTADFTFTAAANVALVANFATAITITATGSPATGGTIFGAGDYVNGASASLEAVANADFIFTKWTEGGVTVSTSPLYTFNVTAPRTLVANFTPAYTITASGWPVGGGTVLGAATVTTGSSITLAASASPGYSFVNWTDANGTEVSIVPSYTFTPTASGDYTANFSSGMAGIHFDFDTAVPALALQTAVPFTQTIAGLTASFSSSNAAPPTVETAVSTGYVLSKFSGHFLAPSAATDTMIDIHFDQPILGVTFNFATVEDPGVPVGSNIRLTATDTNGAAPVVIGNALAHGTTAPGDSLPSGQLTFNSATPFDTIHIELAAFPNGAQKLLIDNVTVSPGSTGGTMLLANPNWNITLSDYGYSDFLLDNTPGFEGREYLSGEWGSAISYTKDGVPVPPTWFDPQFLYPDWASNSTFQVVQGIHLVAANLDGLPIAESIIANSDLEITLRFEMVDTVTGTPMGITPASAGGAATPIDSNRYVLNESFKVRNISGASITNVQLFQLLHGLTSQRGVYDNRAYTGKLSQYRFDATLAGIDASSVGSAGSSAAGLEDYIAFHSKVAPTAFEIGHYGIDDGTDNHSVGKPSDGVHLSIEDNWQTAPFSTRQGTDNFAPANRWVAGGQRWALGNLAAGQSANFDILLSLLTGTKVTTTAGNHTGGSCNGGSTHAGGVDFEFDDATSAGTFFGDYSKADSTEMGERENDGQFALPTFQTPGGTMTQLWNLTYSGTHAGNIHLTFAYDPALLPAGFDESQLVIYHYKGTAWERLTGTVDAVNHKITVATTSLSPFALGIAPSIAVQVPAVGGTVTGGGIYNIGDSVTLTATPQPGYWFSSWTEGGNVVSTSPTYTFTMSVGRALTATFGVIPQITTAGPAAGTMLFKWPSNLAGWQLQESPDLSPGSWLPSVRAVTTVGAESQISVNKSEVRRFFRLVHP